MSCENCPVVDSPLGDIPAENCEFNIKQIQKIVFGRQGVYEFGVSTPVFAITLLGGWSARRGATDETKVVITPYIGGDPVIEPGEAITEGGGDNSTLNGVKLVLGTNPSSFSVIFKGLSPDQEKAFKDLFCNKDLEVFFVTQDKKIIATKTGTGTHTGIAIQSSFFGDRGNQGFGSQDTNKLSFELAAGWSETIDFTTPSNFNPLIDLN